jgi:anti-sigma factor RsiW
MNDHEQVRRLLALGAGGLLDSDGERRLRAHTAECAECRAELAEFAAIAEVLATLPAAAPPPDLVWRTQVAMAAEADRRQGVGLAAIAGLLALALLIATSAVLHLLAGDRAVAAWLVWSMVPSVLGGGAALTLASRRRMERSTL